ncbi:MAG: 6-phosphofructokinase [Deltaproteobacteria bacterium]
MKRIAILTSGGDAPGMNAAVRAATLLGIGKGLEVFGVQHGYQGLLDDTLVALEPQQVQSVIRDGGTMLGSARCLDFHKKERRDEARAVLKNRGIEGLIVIGGNGSLTGLLALTDPAECEIPLKGIGIPASIDNDLAITRLAIGVDTAINTIVDACDKISDTASAHDRTFIVEVMGRQCGYLAMTSAIASAANAVLFPEMGKSEDEVVETVVRAVVRAQQRTERSKRVLVIKAEGVGIPIERLKQRVDERVREETGRDTIETRVTVLGHVVRGGRPSALDRMIASRLANTAVEGLLAGHTRMMTAWTPPAAVPPDHVQRTRNDPQVCLVDLAYTLEETRAMLDGTSNFVKWRKKVFAEIEEVLSL